jgi:glutamine phosphoribosylpyrophosphate amidotransferase
MDGIVGLYGQGDNELVNKTFLATGACQHRGKALGRIAEVIDHHIMRTFQDLNPVAAIGNIGYTKRKIAEKNNTEPIEIYPTTHSKYRVVLTLDGYLIKEDDLRAELEADYSLQTDNKTEVIGALLHKYITQEGITFEAGKKLVDRLHGRATFALTALTTGPLSPFAMRKLMGPLW